MTHGQCKTPTGQKWRSCSIDTNPTSDPPDLTQAAEALHFAVKKLRTHVSFARWVPFVHYGVGYGFCFKSRDFGGVNGGLGIAKWPKTAGKKNHPQKKPKSDHFAGRLALRSNHSYAKQDAVNVLEISKRQTIIIHEFKS
ncbi:hypothetical protein B0H13DRAFT_1868076 [Mycena leptocephala]|nr:hypothetical protein B0H13DRAFT_1868076 [Mycena leptocephala]